MSRPRLWVITTANVRASASIASWMVAALAVTLAFVAAGCGSSGGSDASDTTAAKGSGATTTAASSDLPVPLEGTVNDEANTRLSQ